MFSVFFFQIFQSQKIPGRLIAYRFSIFKKRFGRFKFRFIYEPGLDVSKPHPFLNEFVFWAASLATPATRLKLLPLLPQVALESIDASVQVAWMEWETWQAMCEKTLTFYLVLHNLVATIVRILRLEVGWVFSCCWIIFYVWSFFHSLRFVELGRARAGCWFVSWNRPGEQWQRHLQVHWWISSGCSLHW